MINQKITKLNKIPLKLINSRTNYNFKNSHELFVKLFDNKLYYGNQNYFEVKINFEGLITSIQIPKITFTKIYKINDNDKKGGK